jgi:hypothetical protein
MHVPVKSGETIKIFPEGKRSARKGRPVGFSYGVGRFIKHQAEATLRVNIFGKTEDHYSVDPAWGENFQFRWKFSNRRRWRAVIFGYSGKNARRL